MMPFSVDELDAERNRQIMIAEQAVVQIRASRNSHGAGTIVHGEGLVITNAHVVRGRSPEVVLSSGERFSGRLLSYDERTDLAAISVQSESLPSLSLGNSRRLRPGSLVVALGHPWGVVGAATAGMVIGVGYPVERLPYAGELIQVGLHLRPGHSGGPLLNDEGEVVGINTMIAGPHVGLAIPAATVARFLQETLGSRRRKRNSPRRHQVPM